MDLCKVISQETQWTQCAITALYDHYLGPNNFNDQPLAAENVLNKATYGGRMSHWNFEKYATLHMKQHEIQ